MLKAIRKNEFIRNLLIVVVCVALASYVLFGFGTTPPRVQGDTLASVGDTEIKYRHAMIKSANMRQQFQGQNLGDDFIDQFVVSSLVNDALVLDAAYDAGMVVSDDELRDFVIEQRMGPNGFMDESTWADAILRSYRLQVETYEEFLRERGLMTTKFRDMFANAAYVSEKEVRERFLKDNKTVTLDLLTISVPSILSSVTIPDSELENFYNENPNLFETGPLRRARFVLFDAAKFRDRVTPTEAQIEAHYNENLDAYKQQEQARARHILIKTDERSDEEALSLAQKVREEIVGGKSIEDAASEYSEDLGSKTRGGDTGFFGRGRMVPPFEQAAFSLPIGEISQPVKTQFGYHIIRVDERREERTRPLAEVRDRIENELKNDGSRDYVNDLAAQFAEKVGNGEDFEAAAQADGYDVELTTFFDDHIRATLGDTLGTSPQVRRRIFDMEQIGSVSEPIRMGNRVVVAQWVEEDTPKTLEFTEDNKSRIRRTAQESLAEDRIVQAFAEVKEAAQADPEKPWKELAETNDLLKAYMFTQTQSFGPDSIPAQLDSTQIDFEEEIYSQEVGAFLDNLPARNPKTFIMARVADRTEADEADFDEQKAEIAETLRREKGSDLLSNYLYDRMEKVDPQDQLTATIQAKLDAQKQAAGR